MDSLGLYIQYLLKQFNFQLLILSLTEYLFLAMCQITMIVGPDLSFLICYLMIMI